MNVWNVWSIPVLVGAVAVSPAGAQIETGLVRRSFEQTIHRTVSTGYLLYLPKMVKQEQKKWPLLFYLHGGMGRGSDPEKLMWYPVPKMLKENDAFPFIVVVPQCPEGEMWTDTDMLIHLLDEVMAGYPVDPDRVYLVGYSMGGHGAWYLAYKHPDRFAAVAPMSGMSNRWWATRLKDMPIWAFHGGNDDRVPVSETEDMVEAIKEAGGRIKVTIVPDRTHRPPTPEEHRVLFEWLLEHRISDRIDKKE